MGAGTRRGVTGERSNPPGLRRHEVERWIAAVTLTGDGSDHSSCSRLWPRHSSFSFRARSAASRERSRPPTILRPYNACVHGTSNNCNTYANKTDVYLSGIQNLGDGTYFFAVIVPGVAGPTDGDPNNLSDRRLRRVHRLESSRSAPAGRVTSLGCAHLADLGNKIQIAPFDDTDEPWRRVQARRLCAIVNGLPDTQNCKNDNFKVLTHVHRKLHRSAGGRSHRHEDGHSVVHP